MKVFFAGLSKEDFAKQVSTFNSFNVGSFKSTPKKQVKAQRKSSPATSEIFTQDNLKTIKPPAESKTRIKSFTSPKQSNQSFKFQKQKKPYNPNFQQRKRNSFVKQGQPIPKDQPSNLEVEWTLILLMLP